MAVIRALEVGFGTTSLTTGYEDGEPVIKTFSSFVAQTDPNKSGLNAGLNKRDTVTININGQNYEIGPDAHLASDKSSSRVLNSSYITSDQYQAVKLEKSLHKHFSKHCRQGEWFEGVDNETILRVIGKRAEVTNDY